MTLGFRLHWQNFAEAAPGMNPPAHHSDHATRAEADAARAALPPGDQVVSTITTKPASKVSAKARKLRQHSVEV